MKIAVPAQRFPNHPSVVHGNLATAPFFVIYDTETKERIEVPNPRLEHNNATPNPLGVARELKVNVILCGYCGEWAEKMIEASGVEVFLAHGGLVDQAISDYCEGKLKRALDEK